MHLLYIHTKFSIVSKQVNKVETRKPSKSKKERRLYENLIVSKTSFLWNQKKLSHITFSTTSQVQLLVPCLGIVSGMTMVCSTCKVVNYYQGFRVQAVVWHETSYKRTAKPSSAECIWTQIIGNKQIDFFVEKFCFSWSKSRGVKEVVKKLNLRSNIQC